MSAAEPREVPATPETTDSQGMKYLESTKRRLVTLYLPLAAFLFVLLFPSTGWRSRRSSRTRSC